MSSYHNFFFKINSSIFSILWIKLVVKSLFEIELWQVEYNNYFYFTRLSKSMFNLLNRLLFHLFLFFFFFYVISYKRCAFNSLMQLWTIVPMFSTLDRRSRLIDFGWTGQRYYRAVYFTTADNSILQITKLTQIEIKRRIKLLPTLPYITWVKIRRCPVGVADRQNLVL